MFCDKKDRGVRIGEMEVLCKCIDQQQFLKQYEKHEVLLRKKTSKLHRFCRAKINFAETKEIDTRNFQFAETDTAMTAVNSYDREIVTQQSNT